MKIPPNRHIPYAAGYIGRFRGASFTKKEKNEPWHLLGFSKNTITPCHIISPLLPDESLVRYIRCS